jgi:hypothetical protein
MDRTSLVRLRWRLTGAWLWPCFVALTVIDAAFVHLLPPQGDSESVVLAWIQATVLMMLAMIVISPLLGFVLRRWRGDLPRGVARNYAGTFAVVGVSGFLLAAGLINHHDITRDRAARLDASERAEAWIGDHAPAEFQANIREMDTDPIQPPQVYRSCVANAAGTRYYCVVVDRSKPFGAGVKFAGHESNMMLEQNAY